jgi:L-threonylcarbamoyladenylate synthase
VDSENKATVLRMGGLAVEEIEKIIGPVEVNVTSSSKPSAPGMLMSHYAPRKPFFLGNIQELMDQHKGENYAVLSFSENYDVVNLRMLSKQRRLAEAASNLFAYMRELDESDAELILAERVPNEGLGRAINDRLNRAAALG